LFGSVFDDSKALSGVYNEFFHRAASRAHFSDVLLFEANWRNSFKEERIIAVVFIILGVLCKRWSDGSWFFIK
jgi:hypothetical protein